MTHLITLLAFYIALVVQVGLRYGGAGPWTPSLVLLVGLSAASRSGAAWAAAAGLTCDALAGRPLGVTMLMATLAAAVTRGSMPESRDAAAWRRAATLFLSVAAVEGSSRALAATVVANPDFAAETVAGVQVAFTTALAAFALEMASRLAKRSRSTAQSRARAPLAAGRR